MRAPRARRPRAGAALAAATDAAACEAHRRELGERAGGGLRRLEAVGLRDVDERGGRRAVADARRARGRRRRGRRRCGRRAASRSAVGGVGGAEPAERVGGLGAHLGARVAQALDQHGASRRPSPVRPSSSAAVGADVGVLGAEQRAQRGQRARRRSASAPSRRRRAGRGRRRAPRRAARPPRAPQQRERAGGGGAHVALGIVERVEQRRDRGGRPHVAERRGRGGALPRRRARSSSAWWRRGRRPRSSAAMCSRGSPRSWRA